MRFNLFTSALALAATGQAMTQISSDQLVANINQASDLSDKTYTIAKGLTFFNFVKTAPEIADNFRKICALLYNTITAVGTDADKATGITNGNITDNATGNGAPPTKGFDPTAPPGRKGRFVRDVSRRQAVSPYSTDQQQTVCDAFRGFVKIHSNLLSCIIGKHSILGGTPFIAPIAAALRLVESVVDRIAYLVIDLCPTCAKGASEDKDSLDGVLGSCIVIYSF